MTTLPPFLRPTTTSKSPYWFRRLYLLSTSPITLHEAQSFSWNRLPRLLPQPTVCNTKGIMKVGQPPCFLFLESRYLPPKKKMKKTKENGGNYEGLRELEELRLLSKIVKQGEDRKITFEENVRIINDPGGGVVEFITSLVDFGVESVFWETVWREGRKDVTSTTPPDHEEIVQQLQQLQQQQKSSGQMRMSTYTPQPSMKTHGVFRSEELNKKLLRDIKRQKIYGTRISTLSNGTRILRLPRGKVEEEPWDGVLLDQERSLLSKSINERRAEMGLKKEDEVGVVASTSKEEEQILPRTPKIRELLKARQKKGKWKRKEGRRKVNVFQDPHGDPTDGER